MPIRTLLLCVAVILAAFRPALADPPALSYVFPAGGQRGTAVDVKVGALDLPSKAFVEVLGSGVDGGGVIRRVPTLWFEGPFLTQPDSVQVEDYPRDFASRFQIAADAPVGPRGLRIWNSEGASGSIPFVVGDLPEVVEREVEGETPATPVTLPVTINGRIFPREDVDDWSFPLRAGERLTAVVETRRIDSPLEAWIEVLDPQGKPAAEAVRSPLGDPRLSFVAPADGTYVVKIHDVGFQGGQRLVYRLTLKTGSSVEWVYPAGGRRATDLKVTAGGYGVEERPVSVSLAAEGAGRGAAILSTSLPNGLPANLEVDDLPEALETEPNDDRGHASTLAVPGVGNGRIDRAGDGDTWRLALMGGHGYLFDLRSARLGSPVAAVLSVTDADGNELASTEDAALTTDDPRLSFRPKADGLYFVRIRDRFRTRGGPASIYRLRVTENPDADFRINVAADSLTIPRGGKASLGFEIERLDDRVGPITLEIEGLPEGVRFDKFVVAANVTTATVNLSSDGKAPIRSSLLRVRGTAEVGGKPVIRTALRKGSLGLPEIDTIRLAVSLPHPFELTGPVDFSRSPRGTIHHHPFKVTRGNCESPIEVRIADRQIRHLQGITAPNVILPTGSQDFDFPITLPPWMDIGRTSRTVITTTGIVREPDGTEHEVSHSWPDNVHQIVTVIAPGRLDLQAGVETLAIAPGRVVSVPVKLKRGPGVDGPVRVELFRPNTAQGMSAEPLLFDGNREEGVLRVECVKSLAVSKTVEMILRATTAVSGEPVTAEASITAVWDGPAAIGDSP